MGQEISTEDLVGAYPECPLCKSGKAVRDAWAAWNRVTHEWTLKCTFDHFQCDACGETIQPVWQVDQEFRKKRIRRLNDALRRGHCKNGAVMITQGVQAKGDGFMAKAAEAISAFRNSRRTMIHTRNMILARSRSRARSSSSRSTILI